MRTGVVLVLQPTEHTMHIPPESAFQPAPRLMPTSEVSRLTSLSRTSLARMVEDGSFPQPVRLGERRMAWPEPLVNAFIHAAIAGAA